MAPAAIDNLSLRRVGQAIVTDPAVTLDAGQVAELACPSPEKWRLVKRSDVRTVYFGQLGGQDVYLKHFHNPSLIKRIFGAFAPSQPWRELRNCRLLNACGVPAPEVLAVQCGGAVEWLATRAVAGGVQGDVWHRQQLAAGAEGRRNIRQVTIALAEVVGRMHAAGIVQDDLHCGNVLVRKQAGRWELMLTDLHRLKRRRHLSRRGKAANLAQLLHDRLPFTTRSERLRFLVHYLRSAGADGSLRAWQAMIENFRRRHARRQYASRDRRVLGSNRYFAAMRLPSSWWAHVVLATKTQLPFSAAARMTFKADDWRIVLADPEQLFLGQDVVVIKDSPSSLVVRRKLTVGPNVVDVYIKRARRKRAWKTIFNSLRRCSRAMRAFRLGQFLNTRRIPTALPLAAMERSRGPLLTDSILITEAVDAVKMHRFLELNLARPTQQHSPEAIAGQWKLAQKMLWRLGRLVQRLHDHKFAHRDLKANNMLIWQSAEGDAEAVLVDLDGLSRRRILTARRRFQGLMRLNVSLLECNEVNHSGRLRMLLGYLSRPGCSDIEWKAYWRVLEDWSARKLARQIDSRRRRQRQTRSDRPMSAGNALDAEISKRDASRLELLAPDRVLIIKPSSLGDVVSAMPVLRSLRRAFPSAHIAWLISSSYVSLLEGDDDVDDLIVFERARFGRFWHWPMETGTLIRLLARLRAGRFDWVIDLQGLLRSGLLSFVSGAPMRAGFADAREGASLFYTVRLAGDQLHTVDRNIALARHLGLDARREDMTLKVNPAAAASVRAVLARAGLADGRKFLIAVPPTRWATKRYPVRHWRTVVAALSRHCPVVLLGGGGEEKRLCDSIADGMDDGVVNLAGQTDIPQMVAAIAESAGVICSDSAANFIAPALGVEAVCLMGPTHPERTGPCLLGKAIVAAVACQGCLKKRCRHMTCMESISPGEVIAAALDMLNNDKKT